LSKFEEIRAEAYESARFSKKILKLVHDRMILRKDFTPTMKVLLYDSRLHLFLCKLNNTGQVLLLLFTYFLMVQLRYKILQLKLSKRLMDKC